MNILEIAKSITKEDIEKADEFYRWLESQDKKLKYGTLQEINALGFTTQLKVDVVFFMKWLEQNHD